MMARRGVRAAVGRRGVVRGVGERLRLVDPAPFLVAPAHHDAGAPRSA
jgi:hypothetical protein